MFGRWINSRGPIKQVTAARRVKQDLVISAYKPNGGLEDRFKLKLAPKKASGTSSART